MHFIDTRFRPWIANFDQAGQTALAPFKGRLEVADMGGSDSIVRRGNKGTESSTAPNVINDTQGDSLKPSCKQDGTSA